MFEKLWELFRKHQPIESSVNEIEDSPISNIEQSIYNKTDFPGGSVLIGFDYLKPIKEEEKHKTLKLSELLTGRYK